MRHEPFVLVVSGPSGVGKSTLVRGLLREVEGLWLSVSATTRPPRPGEVHGRDYFFVSEEEFLRMIEREELLEWALVFGRYRYGTPKAPVLKKLKEGYDVVLEVDVQGGLKVKEALGPRAVLVFIAPPSREELLRRLRKRGTESGEELEKRLETAGWELERAKEYDYLIVNDVLEEALAKLEAVVEAERCATKRYLPRWPF